MFYKHMLIQIPSVFKAELHQALLSQFYLQVEFFIGNIQFFYRKYPIGNYESIVSTHPR